MKLTKVAFAVAGLLAAVTGTVHAGQIDSSSSTLAIEVIKSDTQIVAAPTKAYSFAGDLNATSDQQRLQLQYTLDKGTWPVGAGAFFLGTESLRDASAILAVNYQDSANTPQTTFPAGTTINGFVSADRKTLALNVTIPAGATNLMKTPIFTINKTKVVGTDNSGITGLFSVSGATACVANDSSADISFKHFTTHNGAAELQNFASPDSEHMRTGSTNTGRLLNFTQNLRFNFAAAPNAALTDVEFLNQRLKGTNWTGAVNNAGAALVAPTVTAPVTQFYMGKVSLQTRANGLDLNYATQYGAPLAAAPAPYTAANFAVPTVAAVQDGTIELRHAQLLVTLPDAWPAGAVITATDGTGAAIAASSNTWSADRKQVTLQFNNPAEIAKLANEAYIFASFAGNNSIPQTNGITVTGSLVKAAAGTPDVSEQDNSCAGALTGIGGGIKIDVRNYASFATYGTTGPQSLVRVINNSESQKADLFGQIIYSNGKYGPWGKLGELAPRAAVNLSNREVEALLTNAAAATNPFGTGTQYASDSNATTQASEGGDRLRIVSNTGSTLRVQSFIAYPNGVVLDTSNAQGVDFENTSNNRTPTNAVDAQPNSQDAINGLGR